MSVKPQLNIFFDFISPYSYFLYQAMSKKEDRISHIKINWIPVVLAKLFQYWDTKAPAQIQPKREFLFRQGLRYAKKNMIPFLPPKNHPFNPLYSLRLACSKTSQSDQKLQKKIINILWMKIWGEGLSPDNPENLVLWLNAVGLDGKNLLEKTFELDVKNELKENTQLACEEGAFGAPTIIATNPDGLKELFWGNDSLDDAINFINKNDNLDRHIYNLVIEAQQETLQNNTKEKNK